jgi:hypothetical protein
VRAAVRPARTCICGRRPGSARLEQGSGSNRIPLRSVYPGTLSASPRTSPSIKPLPQRLAAALAAAVGALLLLAASASAEGIYEVSPCSGHTPAGVTFEQEPPEFHLNDDCEDPAGGGGIELRGEGNLGSSAFAEHVAWLFLSPPGTEIHEIFFNEEFIGPWDKTKNEGFERFTHLSWATAGGGEVIEHFGRGDGFQESASSGLRHYVVGQPQNAGELVPGVRDFKVVLRCGFFTGGCSSDGVRSIATTSGIHVFLADRFVPDVGDPGGSLLTGASAHGKADVSFPTGDTGSGVFLGEVRIDDQRLVLLPADDNGGQCKLHQPFFTPAPCKQAVQTFSTSTDTALLTDGLHSIGLISCDATANANAASHFGDQSCNSLSSSFTVKNAPPNKTRPTISGTLHPGSPLTVSQGSWENLTTHPLLIADQWLRCTSVTQCTPVPGATGLTYTLTNADLGARLEVRETATVEATGRASSQVVSDQSGVVEDLLTDRAAPAISGSPAIGAKLDLSTGQWEDLTRRPISFASQWLRCPASVAGAAELGRCEAIAGATARSYTVVKADAGKRLVAKVVASVPAPGAVSQAAFSAPTSPVADTGSGAPQTKIAKHPRKQSTLRTARFAFSSDQPGSRFQCKLDKGAFKPCRSPFKHKVGRGPHAFKVRAVGPAGADPSPAKFRWTVS